MKRLSRYLFDPYTLKESPIAGAAFILAYILQKISDVFESLGLEYFFHISS